MVTRTYGPFDYYKDRYDGVTGDRIREALDPVDTDLTALAGIREDLKGDERAMLSQVEGDIRLSLGHYAGMPQYALDQLLGNGHFAAGCTRLLAQHIDTFDTTVNGLNERFNGRIYAAHHIPELRDSIDDWAGYRAEVQAEIKPEWTTAWNLVHEEGDTVAAMFDDGAQPSDLKLLLLAGLMPIEARSYFPPLDFTPAELKDLLLPLYEQELRDAGLIGPDSPDGMYLKWLENAAGNDITPQEIVDIARQADLDENSFDFMDDWEEIKDNDGKSYFVLPHDVSADDARRGTLLTYIFNGGTGYADADGHEDNDFSEGMPYSAEEVRRIMERQEQNKWSYGDHGWFRSIEPDMREQRSVGNGMQVTTPNGVIMGNGGPTVWSQRGGTMYGDVFWLNWDDVEDKPEELRQMIRDGYVHYPTTDGDEAGRGSNNLDLDRLLHHEERHSQQWTEHGGLWMLTHNDEIEEDAGHSDGGY